MKYSTFVSAICVTILTIGFHLTAQAADAIEIKNVAEREVEIVKDGKKVMVRVNVDRAVPGDEIIYTTTFKNLINKPVANIFITNPVPNDSLYKGNSASGANTDIVFSIDGGKQYAAPDKLMVKTSEGKMRPALPSDYTHIRWTYKGELGVGKTGIVSFRAVIK